MVALGNVVTVFVVIFGLVPELAEAGDYCWTDSLQYEYCEYGCCDDYGAYYECCSETVGVIVGAVIGSIMFIAFVSFIVFCFCYIHKRNGRNRGTVIHPNNTTVVTTVATQPGQIQQNPGYQPGYYQGPPGYSQGPPPGYSQGPPPGYNQQAPGVNQGMQPAPYPPQPQPYSADPVFPPPPAAY